MHFFKISLTIKFLALFSFLLGTVATSAGNNKPMGRYNPPVSPEIDQKRTVGGGSRSNCQQLLAKDSLALLVPQEKVIHRTTSKHPTFYFYAKTASRVPLIFNLVIPKPNANNPIVEKTLLIEKEGIQAIKLPPEVELDMGEVYLWQVIIPCSNNTEQIDQVLRAAIERVPISSPLKNQLALADSSLEQAQIYASSGIWYDALSLAREQAQYNPLTIEYIQRLTQEIGINLEPKYLSSFAY